MSQSRKKDDRPLDAKETEQFIREVEALELTELRAWQKMIIPILWKLEMENKELRWRLEEALRLLDLVATGAEAE